LQAQGLQVYEVIDFGGGNVLPAAISFNPRPASALAAAGQGGAAAFGFHAGTEAMLAFAGALGSLVSSFHGTESSCRNRGRPASMGKQG
jgi:hypothetical protein